MLTLLAVSALGAEAIPYRVAEKPWPDNLGNHRVRVRVEGRAGAVWAHVLWRRHDADPQAKQVLVVDAATGQTLRNVVAASLTQEAGDILFEPGTVPGEYFIYPMPFSAAAGAGFSYGSYARPQATADPAWLQRAGLSPERLTAGDWRRLPQAEVLGIEARTPHDRFDPMEVAATADETAALLRRRPEPYLVFPEERRAPIRMADRLPLCWVERGPSSHIEGTAQPGEFYAFQVGLFAARQGLENVEVGFSALRPARGREIPASALRCINTGGVDWVGRTFRKEVDVAQGHVGALWCGVQVPLAAAPGEYRGTLTLRPDNAPASTLDVALRVAGEPLPDAGDSDPWRYSRLRWLDSTIALDEEVTAPFTPLRVRGSTVSCLGRDLTFGPEGLPRSIRSGVREILAGPAALVVETEQGRAAWSGGRPRVTHRAPGAVAWEAASKAGPLSLSCRARMECDGFVSYEMTLKAAQDVAVKDIRLEIPMRRDVARYLMGMGRKGGTRPERWEWQWDRERHQDSVWIGDASAGLQCKLKGENYSRPLVNIFYHRKPINLPPAWYNEGKGGCVVEGDAGGDVLVRAFSGPRTLVAGEELHFDFTLLITPFKPLDTAAQFRTRYYHAYKPPAEAARAGANVINIHHATAINPYINYPFLAVEKLAAYVEDAHRLDTKVKIYYTVRELTTRVAELWALRSLGDEIFLPGPGGGHAWLQEHLGTGYVPAWYHRFPDGDVDAAIVTNGMSRWHNYYLEGLSWLLKNVKIDGLYIDDVAYDREVMKRVRKTLDRERPGSLIDLHSWNHFNKTAGMASCANLYMENLPYIDRIWFGEGFNYDESPDYWLVEISGIPYGVMGEMLQNGGNRWRGMIYGMTTRMPYSGDPSPLWHLWDGFGIDRAKMLGYWDPACPVQTGRPDVLATAYVREGKTLVAVASWAKEPVDCRLAIDWKALGLDPARARLVAPAVRDYQDAATFRPDEAIPVQPGRGWLLVVSEE